MKKLVTIMFIAVAGIFFGMQAFAQTPCDPDPGCEDINNPGEICPVSLPDGVMGVEYESVVTIIPPATFEIAGMGEVDIYSIIIDSVKNMPPGVTWECNAEENEMIVTDPITSYCVLMSGTPTDFGDFDLILYLTPKIDLGFGDPMEGPQEVDDTSLTIHVSETTILAQANLNSSITAYPNPFSYNTKISVQSSGQGVAELIVYDVLGTVLYREKKSVGQGEYSFDFNGQNLSAGTYLYSIDLNGTLKTKRLLKTN